VTVKAKLVEHEGGEFFYLPIILGADDGVDVEAEAVGEAFFQRIERAYAGERFIPVAGHAAYPVVCRAVAVEGDVEVEVNLRVVGERTFDDFDDTLSR
jgi:hypothetical protein